MTAHPAEMEVATANRLDPRTDARQPDEDLTRDLPAAPALILEDYLPYRLSVLSNTVSRALARLYEQRFGLTVAEWRIMAVLARFGPLSANAVCDRTAMDKVQVSRAVARAVDGGLVDRGIDSVRVSDIAEAAGGDLTLTNTRPGLCVELTLAAAATRR